MFKPTAVLMGVLMLGAVAGQLDAQVNVRIRKDTGSRSVEVKVGERNDREDLREKGGRDNRRDNDRGIGQERVWVEDFEIVEESYQEAGHYEMVEKQVFVEAKHVKVTERFWVAETHVMVEECVYVAGQHVTRRVAKKDRCGHTYYINVCEWVPAHHEKRMVEKCIPGHFENREVCKVIPAHYETVCERVFIEGCIKTRKVKRACGGHWEVKACGCK